VLAYILVLLTYVLVRRKRLADNIMSWRAKLNGSNANMGMMMQQPGLQEPTGYGATTLGGNSPYGVPQQWQNPIG